jgi:PAS domain S-box-containing protein
MPNNDGPSRQTELPERRRGDAQGSATAEALRLFIDSVIDYAAFMLDSEGHVASWNAGAQRIKGYDAPEVIGKHLSIFYPPEAAAEGVPQRGLEIAAREGHWEDEGWRVRKDGSRFWANVVITAVRDRSGRLVGFGKVTRDLTERRGVEELARTRARQQEAVAALGQRALAGVDLQTLMHDAVQHVAEELEVEYAKVLELLPAGDALLLRAGVGWKEGLAGQATVSAGRESQAGFTLLSAGPVIVEDLRQETRFSGPRLLLDHGVVSGMSVIIQGRERPWGVLGAHTRRKRRFTSDDSSFLQSVANVLAQAIERVRGDEERARLLARERKVRQEAEAANQAKNQFLTMMSHELRTPLTAIMGYTDLLESGVTGPIAEKQKMQLSRVKASSLHLLALIDEILTFGRIEAGKESLRVREVDLRDVAAEGFAALKLDRDRGMGRP